MNPPFLERLFPLYVLYITHIYSTSFLAILSNKVRINQLSLGMQPLHTGKEHRRTSFLGGLSAKTSAWTQAVDAQ